MTILCGNCGVPLKWKKTRSRRGNAVGWAHNGSTKCVDPLLPRVKETGL